MALNFYENTYLFIIIVSIYIIWVHFYTFVYNSEYFSVHVIFDMQ
jgi:hypothetical protein